MYQVTRYSTKSNTIEYVGTVEDAEQEIKRKVKQLEYFTTQRVILCDHDKLIIEEMLYDDIWVYNFIPMWKIYRGQFKSYNEEE
jgi:hypothetical protein